MRRIVGPLMVLALVFASGCSGSDEAGDGTAAKGASVQARALPEIWADILVQRDRTQAAIAKGSEMWHEDCAEVSSASAALDALSMELGQRVGEQASLEDRRLGIQELVGYLQITATTMRAKAIDETVGVLPDILIGLDALLQSLEKHFTPEEIGTQSVVTRPGFNPVRPPPPPSPV